MKKRVRKRSKKVWLLRWNGSRGRICGKQKHMENMMQSVMSEHFWEMIKYMW